MEGVFSCVPRELTGGVFCYVGGPAEWVFSFVPQGPMEGVFSCVSRELTEGVFCYVGGPAEWVLSLSCVSRELTEGVFCNVRVPRNVCLVLSPRGASGSVFSCVPRELTGGVFCYVGGPAEWVFSDVLVPKMSVSWDKGPTAGNIASTLPPS